MTRVRCERARAGVHLCPLETDEPCAGVDAAAVTEALRAGHAAGCAEWLRPDIAEVLADASAATVDRLEQGNVRHARRRADEMKAASNLRDDLKVPPRIARASQAWLEQLMAEQLTIEAGEASSG